MDIDAICEKLGVCVLSYDAGAEVIERAHLYRTVRDTNGLTFYLGSTPVILFNEWQRINQTMFTVAHELGHIILKHVKPGNTTPAHQGPAWNASPKEAAANQFAARLLAALYQRQKFLTSPLERKVFRQFSPYIRQVQPARWKEA